LSQPDLNPESHSLAVMVRDRKHHVTFHVMFNAYWEPLLFELPRPTPGGQHGWRRWIDTARDAPDDVCDGPLAPSVDGPSYPVEARSLVVLVALDGDASRLLAGSSGGEDHHDAGG
jgi:glycogen operon protein